MSVIQELADLFAALPSRQQILEFRPSLAFQDRASELLAKLKSSQATGGELRELDQFEQTELLMRLIKARLRMRFNE